MLVAALALPAFTSGKRDPQQKQLGKTGLVEAARSTPQGAAEAMFNETTYLEDTDDGWDTNPSNV